MTLRLQKTILMLGFKVSICSVLSTVVVYSIYTILFLPGFVVMSGIFDHRDFFLGLSAFMLSFPMIFYISLKLSKEISIPVNNITKSAQRISGGDFLSENNNEITRIGEVRDMVDSFFHMTSRLVEMNDNIKFWNAASAHELRTSVSGICIRLAALEDGVIPFSAEQFRILRLQSQSLIRLIDDLKVIALSENQKLTINKEVTDVSMLVAESCFPFNEILRNKGREVRLVLIDLVAEVDPLRMKQVIEALMQNAINYTDHGYVIVTMMIEDRSFSISITDSGTEIKNDEKDKIFNKFYRIERKQNNKSGSGLGLAVVKIIVEAHGGKIECIPLQEGTQFKLTIPII